MQADVKTVKYQIVKMMRMLIQICTTLGDLPREVRTTKVLCKANDL